MVYGRELVQADRDGSLQESFVNRKGKKVPHDQGCSENRCGKKRGGDSPRRVPDGFAKYINSPVDIGF